MNAVATLQGLDNLDEDALLREAVAAASAHFPRRERGDGVPQHFIGLNDYLLKRRSTFSMPTLEAAQALSPDGRALFNLERRRRLSRDLVVPNRTIASLEGALGDAMRKNFARTTGGMGLFISAPPASGKTSAVLHVLGEVLASIIDRDPGVLDRGEVPVGYVAVPNVGSARSIYAILADLLGIDYTAGANEFELAAAVRNGINLCKMDVLVIDEVHNLDNGRRDGISVADALRRLSDDIGATVIYAGIDLAGTSITDGTRGEQISNRVVRVPVYDYTNRKEEDWTREWPRIVASLMQALPLFGFDRAALRRLTAPLYERTGGKLSELNDVLTQIALAKIAADDFAAEAITETDIDAVRRTLAGEVRAYAAHKKNNPKVQSSRAKGAGKVAPLKAFLGPEEAAHRVKP